MKCLTHDDDAKVESILIKKYMDDLNKYSKNNMVIFFFFYLTQHMQRPQKEVTPVAPNEFARILTEKLERVVQERDAQERLVARLKEVEVRWRK